MAAEKDKPGTWTFAMWTNDSPKRINYLGLDGIGLDGNLNVSGLSSLGVLRCENNQLAGLNVDGLTKLGWLDCSGNNLPTLNVDGLTGLHTLDCYNNNLP